MAIDKFRQEPRTVVLIGFIFFFTFFFLFFNLGGRTLENQDNMRFAEVGREILGTGDWVMMHLGGNIYIDKPPLHFWNTALSYELFGINTFAARVPSAIFALLGIIGVLLFCLTFDRESPKTGIYAALFLASNYGYAYYARTVRLDMEYSVLFSLSLLSFYLGYNLSERKGKVTYYLLFWIFMGLAFLEKGPVAFIPLLIVLIYMLILRDWKQLRFGILVAASPVLILVVLPWVGLLYKHHDFNSYVNLLEHSRIMTRREGFFYYFPAFMINFFPGSVFLVISIPFIRRWWDAIKERPWLVFCITWFVVYFAIIHLTSAKTFRYLLPVFLPVSVITAWATERMFSTAILSHNLRRCWKAPAVVFAGLVCLAPTVWSLIHGGQIFISIILSLAGFFSLFFVWRKSKDVVIFICIVSMLGLLSLDIIRTTYNKVVSHNLRLYNLLKDHHIEADEVLLYKTDRDVKRMLGFYYNRLPRDEDVITGIEKGVKAVVTPPGHISDVLRIYGSDKQTLLLNNPSGEYNYVVVFTTP